MPYLGGAYATLSAVMGVDYYGDDGNDSDVYRTELDPTGQNAVNITVANGPRYSNDRGVFTTTSNYRLGWVGGDGQNYTRTFPANDYTVWAALSYDGRGAGQLRGSLDLVTSDPAAPNQTVQALGAFNAPGSAGWGRNELVPMKNTDGTIITVHMAGVQTVRFNSNSGDFDYLVFVPQTVTPPPPQFTSVVRNANGSITITWTGTGTLQTATAVTGPWSDVTGATSPFTYTPPAGEQMRFVRIRQP